MGERRTRATHTVWGGSTGTVESDALRDEARRETPPPPLPLDQLIRTKCFRERERQRERERERERERFWSLFNAPLSHFPQLIICVVNLDQLYLLRIINISAYMYMYICNVCM